MWDWQQIVSVAVVLAVGTWLVIGIVKFTPPRDEAGNVVRAAARPVANRSGSGIDWGGCATAMLWLIAALGIIVAAFAFHPALGVAAIAIALLMLMASG